MLEKEKLEIEKQNHTSHIALHTSQKGITLIALIITVIVMLILVGVTINVALNGGLFTKASDASKQMQVEADKEELLSAVVAAIGTDGRVNPTELKRNLPTGWSELNGIYTSLKGNTFTVDENGKITYTGENIGGENEPIAFDWSSVGLDNVDTSKAYKGYIQPLDLTVIISFTGDGKVIIEESGNITEIDATDSDNENLSFSLIISGTNSNILVTMNGDNIDAQIEGLGTITYEKQENMYTNGEVIKRLGITNNTGTYKGTWTEIGTEGGKTKLVSTSNVTTYTLGYSDPNAPTDLEELNGDEDLDFEKAIWSYKNIVNTLNTVAQDATGITSARSINVVDIETLAGIQDSDKGADYNKPYTYNYTNHKDQIFITESGEIVKIDSEEKEVTIKHTGYYKELTNDEIGEIRTLASGYYWLASTCVDCHPSSAYFVVRYISRGAIFGTSGDRLFSSYNGHAYHDSSGVRAVVSI